MFDLREGGVVAELVRVGDGDFVELEEVGALLADELDAALFGVGVGFEVVGGDAEDVAVVRAAESAVGGDQERELFGVVFEAAVGSADERVIEVASGLGELCDEAEDALCVGLGGCGLDEGPAELAGGDHLHRARDALDVADRLDALLDFAGLSHGANGRPQIGSVSAPWELPAGSVWWVGLWDGSGWGRSLCPRGAAASGRRS